MMYRPDGPVELRPVGEGAFVQGLAAASASGLYGPCRTAAAIVGRANLNLGERVTPVDEDLEVEEPVACGDCASFPFDAPLASMLGC